MNFILISQLGSAPNAATSSASVAPTVPRSIRDFDAYCSKFLTPFVAACSKLGTEVGAMGQLVNDAFSELRTLLLIASACKEPSPAQFNELLTGLLSKITALSKLIQRNAWEKHAKTVSEGIGALTWIRIKPAPVDFIESFIGGSDYWANNIRREFKGVNPDQVEFCDTFKKLLLELMTFVKEHHRAGLEWNARGIDVSAYGTSNAAAAAAAQTNAPSTAPAPAAAASSAPAVNIFSDLNKGGAITSGLKAVKKEQQTWRAEYKATEGSNANTPVPPPASKAPAAGSKPTVANAPKGPPKLEFQNGPSKWIVENQSAANGVVTVTIGDKKETVYIYDCHNATINVIGKCKSIITDNCKKTKVHFDTVMASFEVVNCQRMHIECRDKVSSVAVDKTDGIIIQLPLTSLDSSIVASKSSEMNVQWPDANGDIIEKPIPEQYVHRIVNGNITAEVSDLYS